jgi:hypothetical protein
MNKWRTALCRLSCLPHSVCGGRHPRPDFEDTQCHGVLDILIVFIELIVHGADWYTDKQSTIA